MATSTKKLTKKLKKPVADDLVIAKSLPISKFTTISVAAKANTPSLKASIRLILCGNFTETTY